MSPASRMRSLLVLSFLVIASLVVGGLGWVTAATLRLELSDKLRLALWQLDSRVSPTLAREDSRPYQHFDPVYAPVPALQPNGMTCAAGTVLLPSPLLSADLPEWMTLHFQTSVKGGWLSPQVVTGEFLERLREQNLQLNLKNVTPHRSELLLQMRRLPPNDLIARLPDCAAVPTNDASTPTQEQTELQQQSVQLPNAGPDQRGDLQARARQQIATKNEGRGGFSNNSINYELAPGGREFAWQEIGGKWSQPNGTSQTVQLGLFQPMWISFDGEPGQLALARLAKAGNRKVVQGVLLDWPKLRELLLNEIHEQLPEAELEPVSDPNRSSDTWLMTALPVRLNPGPLTASVLPGWSPLRTGLLFAWIAALGALVTVGYGGWTLVDLSERRIRFVSAVTHELRTPLTTLRLYLDMLTSGLVKDEVQKGEYLQTLHGETDRLHRLVGNVLDFARLERQRPKLSLKSVAPADLLAPVRDNWIERCKATQKELIVEIAPGCCATVNTDPDLVQQILGTLIDNACKYSRGASDDRVWLRARGESKAVILEVEDRGPGIPQSERRGIFRAFRRGGSADVTAGGVGLGLALARRWAHLLAGTLEYVPGRDGAGACFQLRLRA